MRPDLRRHHAWGPCDSRFDRGSARPRAIAFDVSTKAVFGFWGIVRFKEPSLRKALAGQLGGSSGIADLKIKVRSRWSDLLFTLLTAGLVVPRSVTFEGVVTK